MWLDLQQPPIVLSSAFLWEISEPPVLEKFQRINRLYKGRRVRTIMCMV